MRTILIVDPDRTSRDLLEEFFSKEMEATCTTARTGEEALRTLSAHPPDLVLSEIEMPELNGFDLLQQIRRRIPGVPVVLMASDRTGYTRRGVIRRGARELLVKPLSLMMAKVKLLRVLQQRR